MRLGKRETVEHTEQGQCGTSGKILSIWTSPNAAYPRLPSLFIKSPNVLL
ncbi:MAG TPA: hypothetical protein VJB99_02605 [Patescibacteria group bacterium]|nr:hypothetical protein [Patescibacteria group bacterium]